LGILVLNAGSSSLKFSLFDTAADKLYGSGQLDWQAQGQAQGQADFLWQEEGGTLRRTTLEVADHGAAVDHIVNLLGQTHERITSVGHRIVHGGTAFSQSVRLDERVKDEIDRLSSLAPLHNPPAVKVIEAAQKHLAQTPQVAVFDTAFYAGLPPSAHVYPLPYEWYAEWGVRRFGFHGISHAYCADRAAQMLKPDRVGERLNRTESETNGRRLVICHLGNGASATAVDAGKARATTMGFTPLEGLMMGTRSGSVDPGILFYLQQEKGLDAAQMDQALNKRSGLLGVSGVSADYRQVEEAAQAGDIRARLALEIYAERVKSTVGSLAAILGGIDALVFTAGIGENAAALRAWVCQGLEFMGLALDTTANQDCQPDADIATADSAARILVIRTREDLLIARQVCGLLQD
jgi:acetate kinase